MFDKLLQAQQRAEEIKKRLDLISVSAEVEGGKIRITSTANKQISSLSINPDFLRSVDQEELEELIVAVVNKVLNQADNVSQTEMQAVTREMMGGLGNLFGK
jgi:nucleoid-associated protein EbfC